MKNHVHLLRSKIIHLEDQIEAFRDMVEAGSFSEAKEIPDLRDFFKEAGDSLASWRLRIAQILVVLEDKAEERIQDLAVEQEALKR